MKRPRFLAGILVSLMMLSGCSAEGLIDNSGEIVGDPAAFPENSSMAILAERDTIRIGVNYDQPLFGELQEGADSPVGFDVEIAKILAKSLGFSEDRIEWISSASTDRIDYVRYGKVDFMVATFTITDDRKTEIGFAGPYFMAQQQLVVAGNNNSISGLDDIDGKYVCVVSGSTGADYFSTNTEALIVEANGYGECLTQLQNGAVDAMASDKVILAGLIKGNPGLPLKVVSDNISEEPYGVAVMLERDDLRHYFNKVLEKSLENGEWQAAWDKYLQPVLGEANMDIQVEDY